MKIYEYVPPKSTRRATGIIIILASAGLGLFLLPSLVKNMPFGWISQMLGVVCVTAMIFVIAKSLVKTFVYAIVENGEHGLDLTVSEIENDGKRQTTVCRISLGNITDAYLLYPERAGDANKIRELTERAKREQRKRFSYCYEADPTPTCILFLEECGEPLFIKISPDEQLFSYIERFSQKSENK